MGLAETNRGGKREGAGKKAGVTRLNWGRQPVINEDGKKEFIPIVTQTPTPQQRTFAALLAKGNTVSEVIRQLHIARQTAYNWKNADWFPVVEREERDRFLGNPIAVFGDMLPQAIQAYQKALQEDDLKLAVQIAGEVFDRIYGKSVIGQQTESHQSVIIQFIEGPETPQGNIIDGTIISVQEMSPELGGSR